MTSPERAKLIPVTGNNDTPQTDQAVDVQFNPTTLKVSLSNTLKENQRSGNSRAAQFVDKSSSTLTVELIFDTSYIEAQPPGDDDAASGAAIEAGSDVRQQTKKIAEAFIKPVAAGSRMQAPKRCLFQWGAFEFIGLLQSFEETLDFFSPEGRPLRATVALKLSEDRYQFRSKAVAAAERDTPTLSSTGAGQNAGDDNGAPAQDTPPVPGSSGDEAGNWRDNALFNGIETPRLPALPSLALPALSLSASLGVSASLSGGLGLGLSGGVSLGLSGGLSVNASVSASVSASVNAARSVKAPNSGGNALSAGQAPSTTPGASAAAPAFKFGHSGQLGTGIEGAFSVGPKARSAVSAGGLLNGSIRLRPSPAAAGAAAVASSAAATAAQGEVNRDTARIRAGVSVAALLKPKPPSGVGFD